MSRRPSDGLRRVLADERFEENVDKASHQMFNETIHPKDETSAADKGAVFWVPAKSDTDRTDEHTKS